MNTVRGRVEILGNRSGVSGLLVSVAATKLPGSPPERSVGSTVTEGGTFQVMFEDDAFQARPEDRSRPNLVVSILAPEGPGATPESRLLHRSEVREAASRAEYFLIRLKPESLAGHQIDVDTTERPNDADSAEAIGVKARVALNKAYAVRQELRGAAREVGKKYVDEARQKDREADAAVREPVLRHLTGVKPGTDAWKRMVQPGEDAALKARGVQGQQIRQLAGIAADQAPVGNLPVQTIYLALSDVELKALTVDGQIDGDLVPGVG